MKTVDKVRNLAKSEREQLHARAKRGEALALWELAVVLGYSYSVLLTWKREGLPLVDGKLPASEAWVWRKAFLASKPENPQQESSIAHLIPANLR